MELIEGAIELHQMLEELKEKSAIVEMKLHIMQTWMNKQPISWLETTQGVDWSIYLDKLENVLVKIDQLEPII